MYSNSFLVAIAFGLAFGLSGQDAARRWLARGENSVTIAAAQINAQQIRENAQNGQRQAEQARMQQQAQAQAYQQQPQPDLGQTKPYQQSYERAPDGVPPEATTYNPGNPR